MGTKVGVAPKQLGISWPNKGARQMGGKRKKCEKNPPARVQVSCRVVGRKEGVLFTPRQKELWNPSERSGQKR